MKTTLQSSLLFLSSATLCLLCSPPVAARTSHPARSSQTINAHHPSPLLFQKKNSENDGLLTSINKQIPGTFSGRIQFLGIYRDYEKVGYGHSSTMGVQLGYLSEQWKGFDAGLTYNYAGVLFDGGKSAITANDDIHVLNEAWIRFNPSWINKTNLTVGRKISNGEIFRKDDFRQKPRSIESIQLQTEAIDHLKLTLGHAIKLSNWIDLTDRWDFNNFGDIFGVGYHTNGLSWAEADYKGISDLDINIFNAYAWDISSLWGTRIQYDISPQSSLLFYYRHEGDLGRAETRHSDAYGISYRQKLGSFTLEPGFFSVHGNNLRFQEVSTGINHPLGASMMICCHQFDAGSDTVYLKATTHIGKTFIYTLYNFTQHQSKNRRFNGQELNLVIKQPLANHLTASVKAGVGYLDNKKQIDDTVFTDIRLLLTYTF